MASDVKKGKKFRLRLKPLQQIVIGFIVVILLGTILLSLPISSAEGRAPSLLSCFFTSVSATCVTGLAVVDTLTTWSVFGQIVILLMIQFGGLGTMSMVVVLALLVRKRISPLENIIVSQSLGLDANENTATDLMKIIVIGTFGFETLGALLLMIRFIPRFGVGQGIYKSIFHSVSAFCNAGFDLLGPEGMSVMKDDPTVLLVLSALIIIGGIGFLVWADLGVFLLSKRKMKLSVADALHNIAGRSNRLFAYTKLVLLVTAILLVSGSALTLAFEWNNALAGMDLFHKIVNAFFHSVSLRTAGFASLNNAELSAGTQVFSIIFMFIGGASGSTAGGIKVSTVALAFISTLRVMGGRDGVVVFRRRIKPEVTTRAMALVLFGETVVAIGALSLYVSSDVTFMQALYEAVSAYATVGLSLGVTPGLGPFAQIVLTLLMFMGRVGVITIVLSLIQKNGAGSPDARRPDAQFLIG